ncbi:MAG: hypothetical protein COB49_07495 [Alphaproteobacteria bacterium]|nr:MAG: hypothetical protein COB49_07495 [Alphaproteobacteria bacterium]
MIKNYHKCPINTERERSFITDDYLPRFDSKKSINFFNLAPDKWEKLPGKFKQSTRPHNIYSPFLLDAVDINQIEVEWQQRGSKVYPHEANTDYWRKKPKDLFDGQVGGNHD